ncbi:MAG: response regulator [Planctomycetota bacterium]
MTRAHTIGRFGGKRLAAQPASSAMPESTSPEPTSFEPQPIVFVVDDDPDIRESLTTLLNTANLPVRSFASAESFLRAYAPEQPGVLLLDMRMPGMDGLEVQNELARRNAPIPILFITAHGEVSTAVQAMRSGAVDFLEKPYRPEDLLERIQKSLEIDRANRSRLTEREEVARRMKRLTPRENEVLALVVRGKSSKEVAQLLGISRKTVDVHRANILSKLEAGSLPELMRRALVFFQPEHPIKLPNAPTLDE